MFKVYEILSHKNIEYEWKNINLINTKISRVLDDKFKISM